jgi:hypothetical protein
MSSEMVERLVAAYDRMDPADRVHILGLLAHYPPTRSSLQTMLAALVSPSDVVREMAAAGLVQWSQPARRTRLTRKIMDLKDGADRWPLLALAAGAALLSVELREHLGQTSAQLFDVLAARRVCVPDAVLADLYQNAHLEKDNRYAVAAVIVCLGAVNPARGETVTWLKNYTGLGSDKVLHDLRSKAARRVARACSSHGEADEATSKDVPTL